MQNVISITSWPDGYKNLARSCQSSFATSSSADHCILLIIQAELLHQLMIMSHDYSSLGFQPVPHSTGSWSFPPSFLLYHLIALLLCFPQKLHENSIQHVKGCKVVHGSGYKSLKFLVRNRCAEPEISRQNDEPVRKQPVFIP